MVDRSDPRSWYEDTASPRPRFARIEGDAHCDVCIVGAGFTGLTAALEIAERGYNVVVLEAQTVGWGASGRSGGQLIAGYNLSFGEIERMVGPDDARALWALGREAMGEVARRVDTHAIACDLTWGHVLAAIKPRHLRHAQAMLAELNDRLGYASLTPLDRQTIAQHVASPLYIGGIHDSASGHLHPLNYAIGLARAAAGAGVRVFTQTPAQAVEGGPNPVVVTPQGRVRARFVLLACNAYIDGLAPKLEGWIMPAGTYIAATRPLDPERVRQLLPSNAAICDMNFAINYFRRSPDHRLLFGGGVSYSGFDAPGLKTVMAAKIRQVFPDLAGVEIDRLWGGYVAITMNRMPQVGTLAPNVFFAHGYSGHGVALAGMAGRLAAEAIAGTAERFDVFQRIPHRRFPGGRWLKTPALVLAMLWFRLLDLL